MLKIEDITAELANSPVCLDNERDLFLFDEIIRMDIDTIAEHENEIHKIIGTLIESFHGNMYFRSKRKSTERENKLRRIAASGKVKMPEEFLYYIDETSFSSDGFFES